MENKIFLGFGILTILSGIYLVIRGDHLIGISGFIVGLWLTYENFKKINAKHDE